MYKSGMVFGLSDLESLKTISGRILLFGDGEKGRKINKFLSQLDLRCFFTGTDNAKAMKDVLGNEFVLLDDITKDDAVFLTQDDYKEQEMAQDMLIKMHIDNFYFFDQGLYIFDCNLQWYFDLVACYGEKNFDDPEKIEREFWRMKEKYDVINVYRMWSSRVGEMIYRFEIMMLALPSEDNQYNVIIPSSDNEGGIANKRLMDIFSRNLNIVKEDRSEFWEYVFLFHASELNGENADYYDQYKETGGYIRRRPYTPYIQLNDEEKQEAREKYEKLQIENEFVCVHARDSFYLKQRPNYANVEYSYHDYRDFSIAAYRKLADYLCTKGIKVVRMGIGGNEKFDHPNVIDFAMESYDELLDLYLNSECKYYVGTYTGASVIPKMFARNVIYVNTTSMIYMFDIDVTNGKEIYSPKLMYSKSKGRYLTIMEMLEFEWMKSFIDYRKMASDKRVQDIVYIENTEDEILNTYIEADKRYCGKWKDDDQGAELQRDYARIFKEFIERHPTEPPFYPGRRLENCLMPHTISSMFLKKHPFLVDVDA